MATTYPGAVDSLPRPTSATQMDASGFEGDVVVDNLSDAVEAIETELGTDPAGTFATVKARLAALDLGLAQWDHAALPHLEEWCRAGWPDVASLTNDSIVATRLVGQPLSVTRSGSKIKGFGIRCTTSAAGSTYRLGLYASDADGEPTDLVAGTECTVATTSTGILTATFTGVALTPGLYWVASVAQGGTPSVRGYGTSGAPTPTTTAFALPSGTGSHVGVKLGATSGALPDPAGTIASGDGQAFMPLVAVQIGV